MLVSPVITLLLLFQKPAEVCRIIGLCGSPDKQEMLLSYFVREALQVSGRSENVAEVRV